MRMQFTLTSLLCSIIISINLAADKNSSEQNFEKLESCESGYYTSNWQDCANRLGTLIWNTQTWFDNQPIRICELQCSRKLKGRISNYQWVWDAKFECRERAPGIIGEARGFQVRRNAMIQAMTQTIEQGIIFGKLTPDDFKCD